MTSQTDRYKFIGTHVGDLHDGRILEPGGYYELTKEDLGESHNKRYVDEGQLISAPEQHPGDPGKSQSRTTPRGGES